MLKRTVALAVLAACTGCASIMNETSHPVKVETLTPTGATVTGADCKLTNDYGTTTIKSGSTGPVRRSNKDLDIVCTDPANPEAEARAISRVNAGMFGNIIIGGGVGAIIDHTKGTAYTYPTWVQLVFGKSLVFDRNAEQEGKPAVPTDTPKAAAAPAGSATTAAR